MKIVKIYTDNFPYRGNDVQGGIEFDNGVVIVDRHQQDCCENVYADWEQIKNDTLAMSHDFSCVKIRNAKGGFRFGDGKRWFYVPCYDEQNGYYNDQLEVGIGTIKKQIGKYGRVIQKISYFDSPISVNTKYIDC